MMFIDGFKSRKNRNFYLCQGWNAETREQQIFIGRPSPFFDKINFHKVIKAHDTGNENVFEVSVMFGNITLKEYALFEGEKFDVGG